MKQIRKIGQGVAAGAVAMSLLAFAGTASAVTYDIQDGNIISILNLPLDFDDSSPMEDGLYNVFFVTDTGVDQYGSPPTWDFMISEDGVAALPQITDALNAAPEAVTGASATGSDDFFIPLIQVPIPFVGTVWGAVGAEEVGLGTWGECQDDCILGVTALGPDNVNTFARVSLVPVPAAVWLFGSGLLGLIGMARRRKTA